MTIKPLDEQNLHGFKEYCRKHRFDHDESFLHDDDLNSFELGKNVTFILFMDGTITGAFSVMKERHYRTRIFHAEAEDSTSYGLLHCHMVAKLSGTTSQLGVFMPDERTEVISYLEHLGYKTDRFVYVLERDRLPVAEARFPDEFSLSPVSFPADIEDWTYIRNTAFRPLKGFVEYSVEDFLGMMDEPDFLPNATFIVKKGGRGVAIIKAERDEQPDGPYAFIGPIAVLPEYQGRGLGRNLLRVLLQQIQDDTCWKSSLCVNADNEDALKLYISEGFVLTETVRHLVYEL